MSTYIFINAYSGKSKSTQNPFTRISIASLNEKGESRIWDLFTQNGVMLANQNSLRFGDVVEPKYLESEYPGGRPSLCALEVVAPSPYFSK